MGVWLGLVLLLASAGLIAYLGDLIGRRIGKKRLTIFGLRPKNTAILFTVATGIGIAALTVIIILLVSTDLRNRIINYNRIVSDLKTDASVQRQAAQQSKRELTSTQADLGAQRELVKTERRAAESAQQARREADARLLESQAAVGRAESDVRRKEGELRTAQSRVDAARANLETLKGKLGVTRHDLEAAQTEITSAVGAFNRLNAELNAARSRLLEANEQVSILVAREGLEALNAEVLYKSGEELYRRLMRRELSPEQVLLQLQADHRALDELAKGRGVGANRDEAYAVPMLRLDEKTILTGPAQVFGYLARWLVQRPTNTWLRVVTIANCVKGQPLFYKFVPVADTVAFNRGDVVAEDEFDGTLPEDMLVDKLRAFVSERVRPRVAEAGVLPQVDGRPLEVGFRTWLPALRQLEAARSRATVTAVATTVIRVGDGALAIEFRVTPHAP